MVVTIDTNVLFQVFYSSIGASHKIVRIVRDGEIEMAISVPVFQEYQDVLSRLENRKLLGLKQSDIDSIMDFVETESSRRSGQYDYRAGALEWTPILDYEKCKKYDR